MTKQLIPLFQLQKLLSTLLDISCQQEQCFACLSIVLSYKSDQLYVKGRRYCLKYLKFTQSQLFVADLLYE